MPTPNLEVREARRGRRRAGAPKPLEKHIQSACAGFLALDGWRPLQTDPTSDRARGKGFGELGMADHLFLRPCIVRYSVSRRDMPYPKATIALASRGEILWVEFKRPGTSPTDHQLDWHFAERLNGFMTAMASIDFEPTYEGFVSWYRESGLLRRQGL
jgi:hypothetical protein